MRPADACGSPPTMTRARTRTVTTVVWAAKCRAATGTRAPQTATSTTSPSGRGSTAANPAKSRAPSTVPAARHSTRDTRGPRSGLTRKTAVAGSQYQCWWAPYQCPWCRAWAVAAAAPKHSPARRAYSRPPAPRTVRTSAATDRLRVCRSGARPRSKTSAACRRAASRARRAGSVRAGAGSGPARELPRTAAASRRGPSAARFGTVRSAQASAVAASPSGSAAAYWACRRRSAADDGRRRSLGPASASCAWSSAAVRAARRAPACSVPAASRSAATAS